MRCIKIIFVFLLTAFNSNAQFVFSAQGGVAGGYLSSQSLQRFADVYNASQIQADIKTPMKLNQINYGCHFQTSFMVNKLYSGLNFAECRGHARAEFSNGAERVLDVKQKIVAVYLGYYGKGKRGSFCVYTGFHASGIFISTYLKYVNGNKDYVSGIINGTYKSSGFGVPFALEKSFNLSDKWSWYIKAETFYNATHFTFYRAKSGPGSSGFVYGSTEVIDDFFTATLQTGIKFTLYDINIK